MHWIQTSFPKSICALAYLKKAGTFQITFDRVLLRDQRQNIEFIDLIRDGLEPDPGAPRVPFTPQIQMRARFNNVPAGPILEIVVVMDLCSNRSTLTCLVFENERKWKRLTCQGLLHSHCIFRQESSSSKFDLPFAHRLLWWDRIWIQAESSVQHTALDLKVIHFA